MSQSPKGVRRIGLLWRFQTQENQKYAPLVEYLNASEDLPYPKTEIFLQAITAFWYPFALRWIGRSPPEVKTAASFSIKALELHIALLKDEFYMVHQGEVWTKENTNGYKLVSEGEEDVNLQNDELDLDDDANILDVWMNNQKSL